MTATGVEHRTVRVHEGSTQCSRTEACSAPTRCHTISAGLWRQRPSWNAHICYSKRLESKFHLGLLVIVVTGPYTRICVLPLSSFYNIPAGMHTFVGVSVSKVSSNLVRFFW